ncbi:ribonuclease T2 family protein [Francisella marina]|uniref:Ribonuclease I n=2 Tax=Francisella TaxID=262 RepID=A0ABX5ZG33_9GAMM|nr:ribonuclease I [Francisella marina]QEO57137.1 ribonuclease I [Francisella marina]QEO58748.1 ribonuclease I [Francisella marina]
MKIIIRILVIVLLALITTSVYAVPAKGTFTAESSCQAYISKNKMTNPDNTYVIAGQIYSIQEKNKDTNPDWFRVFISNASESQLRWVSSSCGIADIEEGGDTPAKQCVQEPGLADSYVLALSWQPAFCETYGFSAGKQECKNLPVDSAAAKSFSLHGFWPNQDTCGTNYGFCDAQKQSDFCNYAPLNLDDKTMELLHSVMPGYNDSSCLQRHEWYKHGTCQLHDQNQYYTQAATFVNQINDSKLEQLFSQNIGKDITIEQFDNAFNQSFGAGTSNKVYLNCKDGMLVDVYISLPKNADEPSQKDLSALLANAPNANQSTCQNTFKISNFSHNVG